MKRLLTIFLLSIVAVNLWSQASKPLPMVIAGDVYINDNGTMLSEGPVHIKALPVDTGKVANYGKFLVADETIFLYSNDYSDGLLLNTGTVTAKNVAVRKTFVNSNMWYMMSFPFDVDVTSGLANALNGNSLTRGVNFEVQEYDAKQRANQGDRGTIESPTWKTLVGNGMSKGKPCRVAVKLTTLVPNYQNPSDTAGISFSVDFYAANAQNISDLFALSSKTVGLTYTQADPDLRAQFLTHNSEGWNPVGGMNSTNFKMSKNVQDASLSSINCAVDGIWAWIGNATDWVPIDLTDNNIKGTLRPYGVIFVQTLTDDDATGGFTYLGGNGGLTRSNGLALDMGNSSYLFRSSNDVPPYDKVKLQLTNAKTNADDKAVPVYFKFNDDYSRYFKTSEDEYTILTSSSDKSVLWALAQEEGKTANNLLFIDALSYEPNEVALGVSVPAAGEYVFSLQSIYTKESIKSAVLWDKDKNLKTELLTDDYHFQAPGAFNTEDRFSIFFNSSDIVTSIDQAKSADIYAYTNNNVLTVKNLLSGDKVQVLDLTGRIIAAGVASGNTYTVDLNQKGVYIVNARSGEKILKVLNK